VPFIGVNPLKDDASMRAWKELGAPPVPFVKVGDRVQALIHVSQLYSLLGLDLPAEFNERALAWDVLTMMESWLGVIRSLDHGQLFAPTPARNRSPRDLLVDTFEKIAKGPPAWSSGDYVVVVDTEDMARTIGDLPGANRYAQANIDVWRDFLLDHFSDEGGAQAHRSVAVWEIGFGKRRERGTVEFGVVLSFLRNHTAMHLRQVTVALDHAGIRHPGDGLDAMTNLHLPDDVYGANADQLGRLDHQRLV
jgi:hypothetical protein